MPREHLLLRTQVIPQPLEQVFAFFADAANLQALTPPWLHFRIHTPLPIEMRAGALIDYSLRIHGVPVRWRTRIETWEPCIRFVDMQIHGPYALWHHTHEFEPIAEGVRMIDRVRYSIPYGPLGGVARWLFVDRMLKEIFDYRFSEIGRLLPCQSPGSDDAVAGRA